MVASDRVSAFDVVFAEPIPDKGRVLTAMTVFWCEELADVVDHAIVTADPAEIGAVGAPGSSELGEVAGRAMLCGRPRWSRSSASSAATWPGRPPRSTPRSGTVHTMADAGRPAARRPAPRADVHPLDQGRGRARPEHRLRSGGVDRGRRGGRRGPRGLPGPVRRAAARVAEAGFILADTKFELGRIDGRLVLCDEVVTPDSSRLWPADAGGARDDPAGLRQAAAAGLGRRAALGQDPAGPRRCPPEVVAATSARYVAAYERVTGRSLADWYGPA